MNKVVLIGRLTKDPELRYIAGTGNAVTTFTIAIDRRFNNKEGKKEADFVPIVVWGKSAEFVANYGGKGRLIGVSGRIQTGSYEAKDGTRRYTTDVVADDVQFLDKGNQTNQNKNTMGNNQYQGSPMGDDSFDDITPVDDGEIPF
ncbi:MAG: single-stranded DNA-binding protein [Clostridiaceae bacterium]